MRPLRVGMIIQGYHPRIGGAERQLAAISKRMQSFGVEIHVVTRRFPGLSAEEIIEGVPVHRIAVPGPKPLASLAFTAGALPVLARLRPDIVHAHELLSPTTTALAYKALTGVPVVAKVLRGGELGDLAKLRRRAGILRLGATRDWVDGFAVISREIDAELAELGVPEERRNFIPNGVDVDLYRPPTSEAKWRLRRQLAIADGPVALFAGRLEDEKRVHTLVALWPRIRAAVPEAVLLIAGTGSQEMDLKQAAGDGVRFLGAVENMAAWYQAADVFVLPSSCEGLSNALLEAMACGLRCVATITGGAPDLIDHGHCGYLVAPDDPAALEEHLIQALASKGANDLGVAARNLIVKDYSIDSTVGKLLDLYQSLRTAEQHATP